MADHYHLTDVERAEIARKEITRLIDQWGRESSLPGAGPDDGGDAVAILVSANLWDLLEDLPYNGGPSTYLHHLLSTVPIPLVLFFSLEGEAWQPLLREEANLIFDALFQAGWHPDRARPDSLN